VVQAALSAECAFIVLSPPFSFLPYMPCPLPRVLLSPNPYHFPPPCITLKCEFTMLDLEISASEDVDWAHCRTLSDRAPRLPIVRNPTL
jgi:hypothetical protein